MPSTINTQHMYLNMDGVVEHNERHMHPVSFTRVGFTRLSVQRVVDDEGRHEKKILNVKRVVLML